MKKLRWNSKRRNNYIYDEYIFEEKIKPLPNDNGLIFKERNCSGYRHTLRHIRPYLRTVVGY